MRAFMAPRFLRRSLRSARAALCGAAAVAVLVALVASGCDDNGTTSGPSTSSAVGATPSPVPQQWLSDLIAPPDVSFEVVFRRYKPAVDASSYFVWRQGYGRRRWDDVSITPEGFWAGDFSLEIGFPAGARLGDPSLGCGWSTRPAGLGQGEALVMCSSPGWSSFMYAPVTAALESYVGEALPEESILGRRASCYSIQRPITFGTFDRAVVCLDLSQGIPLRLEIEDRIDYGLTVAMEAISVSLEEQDLVVPVELQPNPDHPEFSDLRQFNGTMPMSTLQLPDFSQFEE